MKKLLCLLLFLSFYQIASATETMVIQLISQETFYVEINKNGIAESKKEKGKFENIVTFRGENISSNMGVNDFKVTKNTEGVLWLTGTTPLAVITIAIDLKHEKYILTKTYRDIFLKTKPLILSQNYGIVRVVEE